VFLWVCGLFLTGAATCVLLGLPETLVGPVLAPAPPQPVPVPVPVAAGGAGDGDSTSIEGTEVIADKYLKLVDVCGLPAVHALLLFIMTMQVPLYQVLDIYMHACIWAGHRLRIHTRAVNGSHFVARDPRDPSFS